MSVVLGPDELDDLRLGEDPVDRGYLGWDLVWYRNLPSLPNDIYFASDGDDFTGDGSIGSPLKTISMANFVGAAGKTLHFRGGDIFEGRLVAKDGCTYTSYGVGRAKISSGMLEGIFVDNAPDVIVDGLEFFGAGNEVNATHGIAVINSLWVATQITGVVITNCLVHDYGYNGICGLTENFPSGFTGLQITDNEVYDCTGNNLTGATGGIVIGAEPFWGLYDNPASHFNVVVTGNYVHDCAGTVGAANHVGSGIIVSQTDGGLVEDNLAEDNGANSTNQAGPVGIWAWDSIEVIIRKNIVRRQDTAGPDGSAFDLDGGCVDCVLEYNFSQDCKGPGILMFAFDDTPFWSSGHRLLDYTGNIARFNISIGDGDNDEYSKYSMFIGTMRPVATDFQDVYVYNNTVISKDNGPNHPTCLNVNTFNQVSMDHATGVICNNIFVQLGAGLIVDMRRNAITIAGNVFYSSQGTAMRYFGFDWFDPEQWTASTGDDGAPYGPKEFLHANHSYYFGDPELIDVTSINPVDLRPSSTSPIYSMGMDIAAEFGLTAPTEDYLGVPISATKTLFSPGACQEVTAPTNRMASPNDISVAPWTLVGDPATIVGGQAGMYGNAAQLLRPNTGSVYSEIAQPRTYTAGAKTLRRGVFVKAVDVPDAVLGNWGPAFTPDDYWHTWFTLTGGGVFDDAEAFGWYINHVKRMRMQQRPNGFWLISHDVEINPAWTQDHISSFASLEYANVPPWGITGNDARGVIYDGFFEYLL